MIKEKKCSVCGNNREFESIFCKPCRKEIVDNIILLVKEEELTGGTPVIRAVSRRLYEKHYQEFQSRS